VQRLRRTNLSKRDKNMKCDELTSSNNCCADFDSDRSTSNMANCMARAAPSRHCDGFDLLEDRLWVI
jgi:hypothetical protein